MFKTILAGPVRAKIFQKEFEVFILVSLVMACFFTHAYVNQQNRLYYEDQISVQNQQIRLIEKIKFGFKVQVQEWKNILLRGENQNDFVRYYGAFLDKQKEVQEHAGKLAYLTRQSNLLHEQSKVFLLEHGELFERYLSALNLFEQQQGNSTFMVDSTVRGIDRKPTQLLTELEKSVQTSVEKNVARYTRISRTIELGVCTFFISALFALLFHLFRLSKKSTRITYTNIITGMYNQQAFYMALENLLKNSESVTFYLADIDNFKTINEVRGISGANKVLEKLETLFVRNENITRYHVSSNFFVFTPSALTVNTQQAEVELEAYFDQFRRELASLEPSISFTTCVCTFDINTLNEDELFNRCSAAMQEAKEHGKGLHHNYQLMETCIEKRQNVMRIASSIEDSIQKKEFVLYGQLIKANQRMCELPHYEVLLRIKNGQGHGSPHLVLEAAEKYDKSVEIDRFVVDNVFNALVLNDGRFACSINLSAKSLSHDSFVNYLVNKVSVHHDIASLLTFELTETAIINNLNVAQSLFSKLREKGCKIAIDDFGVGESSLRYLMELPVDIVKIDGSFIKRLVISEKAKSLVTAIVSICQSLNIKTVAEYVENEELQAIVKRMGITYSQGYGIHKPEPLPCI